MTETPRLSQPLIEARGLTKRYTLNPGLVKRLLGIAPMQLVALNSVDLKIYRGEIFGLVGESGSGKSSLGRTLLRLEEPTSGELRFDGQDMLGLDRPGLLALRRKMQMVFQDPYSSLNPRLSVRQMLAEVLHVHGLERGAAVASRITELLATVGLSADTADRYPRHFSGGQRQRLGIARALAVRPSFIVADEPVSSVDVSVQAQIMNLLVDLRERLGLTLLIIAHDLSVVRYVSNRVGVMYLGRIVEVAPRQTLFSKPRHPYTQGLLLAAPRPDPTRRVTEVAIRGEPPSPLAPPTGCAFHTRCPLADDRCRVETPVVQELGGHHSVACHHHHRSAEAPPRALA